MSSALFWSKVDKRGPDECWEWTGRVCPKGYGYFDRRRGRKCKWKERAHRHAWSLVNGEIPKGLHVLHRCDNPKCVNPRHLFLGTHRENMQDKVRKGRQARNTHVRGEMQGNAVLTDGEVLLIRELAGSLTQRRIGERFGIGQDQVSRIVNRKIWTHI